MGATTDRYVVISADCHGGGDIPDYRPYLENRLHGEFDAWRASFANPYDDLQDDVQRAFSGPMIVVALMILPLLAIDFVWSHRINMNDHRWLQVLVETGYSITWLAFTVEFVVMVSIVNHKLRYLKKHWVDLLIICLPLLAFLRVMQLSHILRMQQVTKATRVYRLRGVALRVWRGILALDVLSRLIRVSPERKIESLKQEIAEREREIAKLQQEVDRLQAELEPNKTPLQEGEAA
jgi:hypothetical protein